MFVFWNLLTVEDIGVWATAESGVQKGGRVQNNRGVPHGRVASPGVERTLLRLRSSVWVLYCTLGCQSVIKSSFGDLVNGDPS